MSLQVVQKGPGQTSNTCHTCRQDRSVYTQFTQSTKVFKDWRILTRLHFRYFSHSCEKSKVFNLRCKAKRLLIFDERGSTDGCLSVFFFTSECFLQPATLISGSCASYTDAVKCVMPKVRKGQMQFLEQIGSCPVPTKQLSCHV